MDKVFTLKNCIVLGVVVGLATLASIFEPESSADTTYHWYSVLPPLLAVSLAIISGRILISLLAAVVIGGLLSTVPESALSIVAWGTGFDTGMSFVGASLGDTWNMQLLAFVVFTLTMVCLVIVAGGLHGVVQWLSKFAKGPKSAQLVTYLMGLLIFIDDYANTMIVGTAMRPVTDKMRISREKLAFIVDSTSAPIAGMALISTWVGYEVSQMVGVAETLKIDLNGYALLFNALPFRFYCILMLVFVLSTILFNRDYGPMASAQRRAAEEGKVEADDAVPMTSDTFSRAEPDSGARVSAITALIPIGLLFVILLGGIWVDGGGMAKLAESAISIFSFFTWRDVISASEDSVKILAYGSGISLGVAVICSRLIAGISYSTIRKAIQQGVQSSMLPVIILVMAWSLKAACDSLSTGPFLVAIVGDSINPAFFPAIVFIIAGMTSFATGTSYGTMAILMPTAVPIAFALEGDSYGLITMITFGAILDGAIFGDHCSPISDTTIMSSISSASDHMHHVRTQLPYSMTVGILALACGYLPAGFGMPSWIGFVLAISLILGLFIVLSMRKRVPVS
jgi:Na+/H+ antiporter NhaC